MPRILLAEDHDSFAASLEILLRRQGHDPERARDGVEALSRIAAAPPDLLLLDLKLPRLHGIDLLKKLRQSELTRNLPVIIMTGVFRGERYAQAAKALGVETYLEKPFSAGALLAALERHLPKTPEKPPKAGMEMHLRRAFFGGFCGRYRLQNEGAGRILSFARGLPVHLDRGFTCTDLGEHLRRRGVLSAEEFAYYRGPGEGRPHALVEMGCLTYPELVGERLAYLGAELSEAFALPPFAVVEEPVPAIAENEPLAVNLSAIVYRGFHRHPRPDQAKRLFEQCATKYLGPTRTFFRLINFLDLNPEERAALPHLDGSRTLAESPANRAELLPLLLTLHTLEMVRFSAAPFAETGPQDMPLRAFFNAVTTDQEAEPRPEEALENFRDLIEPTAELAAVPIPIPDLTAAPTASPLIEKIRQTRDGLLGKNYYQIFGLDQGRFSFELLKNRYFEMTREFGPDLLMQLSGEESAVVEELLATVAGAYNTLSDVVKKERYDELLGSDKIGLGRKGDDQFHAQVQFQSGKVFLGMEEWDSAEKALQDACTICPENGDYLANLAWAIYRNPRNSASRAMQEKARQLLNRALGMDRTADGFAYKGWMLFASGQDTLAEAELSKSLKLDPRHTLARKGLRELLEKREQQKKGLFGRMFR